MDIRQFRTQAEVPISDGLEYGRFRSGSVDLRGQHELNKNEWMEDRRPTVVVTAAILRRGSEILLCHRHPERDHYPDVWDLPGGHVEDGESLPETLARELHEELGIRIDTREDEPWRVFREGDVELSVFLIDHWSGELQNRAREEHDEIQWVDPTQLDDLQLAHPIYESLLSEAARQE